MGDSDLGTTAEAVELPPPRVLPLSSRRRHRPLTGTAGVLLFVCMFLPAIEGCREPIVPLELPPFVPPYLYGLAFAFIALARTRRGLRLGVIVLRGIGVLVAVAGFAMMLLAPAVGLVEVLVGCTLLATIGKTGASERRVAATAILVGAICTLWFGAWSATPDALLGVYLSLASSLGLLTGGMLWLGELMVRPMVVPRAVLRRS